VAIAVLATLPAPAAAAERAALQVRFSPERLGQSTTVGFSYQLTGEGGVPPPLTRIVLHTTAGLSYLGSTLGLAFCEPLQLVLFGAGGCPANSRIGSGSAQVAVPLGPGGTAETASIQAFMARPQGEQFVVLFTARGTSPVAAQLFFQAEWNPGSGSAAGSLNTAVPLVPTVPNGADVSIVSASATLGPGDYFYTRRVHGRTVRFRPRGVSLPERCPRGGFPFSAQFYFSDGSSTSASADVSCPRPHSVRG
jgi:hypothetical protein